jgi:uncharacterized membrane protein YccC
VNNWTKVAAGIVVGIAGTVYATNEEARKNLPKGARDLPENIRRRYRNAVSAAREASSRRREEILRDLEEHDRSHAGRVPPPAPVAEAGPAPEPEAGAPDRLT